MIRFALACDNGHEFESWFPSSASYDAQAAGGFVSCPICNSAKVEKRIMAPAIAGTRSSAARPSEGTAERSTQTEPIEGAVKAPVAILSEREMALRAMLRSVREHVTKNADYVGTGFAEEARRMHYGEIEHRSVYGEASPSEAKALIEEGIEVHPLPTVPDDRN